MPPATYSNAVNRMDGLPPWTYGDRTRWGYGRGGGGGVAVEAELEEAIHAFPELVSKYIATTLAHEDPLAGRNNET